MFKKLQDICKGKYTCWESETLPQIRGITPLFGERFSQTFMLTININMGLTFIIKLVVISF